MRYKEVVDVFQQCGMRVRNRAVELFRAGRGSHGNGNDLRSEIPEAIKGKATIGELRQWLPPELLHSMLHHHSWHFNNLFWLALDMEPAFSKALEDGSITGWLCANDAIAFMAMRYLQMRGKKVPLDIAVAGFDNHPLAQVMGLTTYDMGYHQLGIMAVNMLAGIRRSSTVSMSVGEGFLVRRSSSAVRRQRAVIL